MTFLAVLGLTHPDASRTELLTPPPSGLIQSATSLISNPQIRINQFRFARRKGHASERLVIEFVIKDKKARAPKPEIKLSPHPSGKEITVYVSGVVLSGAIPESSINDSFVSQSQFLGPISISTDDPVAPFALRLFFKAANPAQRSLEWDGP